MQTRRIFVITTSILIAVLIFSGVYATGAFAGNSFITNNKFTDHTYIGPFNISNNKTKQAKTKLASDFAELQTKLEVNLLYQDIQFSLPPEIIKFDIDMTLANANSGEDNPIIANVSREGLRTVLSQQLTTITLSNDAVNSVAAGIEKELQTGIMPRNVYITDYLGNNKIEHVLLASSDYSIDGIAPALSKALNALDDLVIQPFESFSMMELLMGDHVDPLSDEEMTLLASILYNAILQTNFQIDERNISTTLPQTIQLGFEAAMNQTLGLDFKFTNINKTEFTIRAAWSAGAIHLSIEGLPFFHTYVPSISTVETYEPETVRQYSAFVNDGQVVVSQVGEAGMEAIVTRTLTVNGTIVNSEHISEDFYAPVHRIEIHPLSKGDSVTNDINDEETNLTQTGNANSDTGTKTANSGQVESNNSVNEELGEGDTIYDKSGLPISGK
ncbi:VanW family protein [Sporosarcina sp. UB5]|uniref:VanW family protein n=1 Tax=Sporosarcina sp. UB5 TaxID=3047463 RepID=UPI003D7AADC9